MPQAATSPCHQAWKLRGFNHPGEPGTEARDPDPQPGQGSRLGKELWAVGSGESEFPRVRPRSVQSDSSSYR